jgi:dTDP-4-amino-4,6-dideoxygalactose transaminase
MIPNFSHVAEYMSEGFKTGQLSNFGPTYKRLVNELTIYLNLDRDKEIVLTSSGHTALMAAYYALGVVSALVPAFTFPSTVQAAEMQNVDCEYYDMGSEVPDTASSDTVVITTCMSCIPSLGVLESTCHAKGKKLIVDGAPSFGTPGIYNFGDAFILSFHATKTFGIGEGGAIICSKEHAEIVKEYINFGFNEDKNVGEIGINGKISEYSCGVGLALLENIDLCINLRLRNASIYKKRLEKLCPFSWVKNTVYQTFPIFAEDSIKAQCIRDKLTANNVQHLQYYKPLANLKNSINLYERNICLPVHQNLTLNQVNYICDLVLSQI